MLKSVFEPLQESQLNSTFPASTSGVKAASLSKLLMPTDGKGRGPQCDPAHSKNAI